MSEESGKRATFDPTELWRQWFEAGTNVWSNVLGGNRENYLDPYGLYRQWFNGLDDAWKQMFGSVDRSLAARNGSPASLVSPAAEENPAAATNPVADAAAGQAVEAQNLWKQWFEATADSWQKAAALGAEAVELAPRWMAMLDQIRHNFLSAEGYPTDPLQFATRWYNATSGPFSDFVGDLIEREDILDVSSRFLQNYASFYRVFRRDSEEYLKGLSIPVRSDISRVAGLVVALEDKIDRLEEAFEEFEYGYTRPATAESLEAVEKRIERLESTLERIEGGAATADSVSELDDRLNEVEAKIDQILATLENGSQSAPQAEASQEESTPQAEESEQTDEPEIRATPAARRLAQELGVDLSEVEGTGTNGQITVNDVRGHGSEEGES